MTRQRNRPAVPYLEGARFRDEGIERPDRFPFNLPWLVNFDLRLDAPVTFFVGENGSGKSTLIEAIAALCGLPVCGGSPQEMASEMANEKSELAEELSPVFIKRPRDGYFFRTEYYAQFANLLDERKHDPDFRDDPYNAYGGRSLHTRSHGESFLELMQNRFNDGLFLMDEPESALSPQRQLTLLALIADRVAGGKAQFLIATHSPILLTCPGATILSFDDDQLQPTTLEETSHYNITKGMLDNPAMYWQHLAPTKPTTEED